VTDLREVLPRSLETLEVSCTDRLYGWRMFSAAGRSEKVRHELCDVIIGAEFPNIHEVRVFDPETDSEELKQIIQGWEHPFVDICLETKGSYVMRRKAVSEGDLEQ
jgi:hypothetical protein